MDELIDEPTSSSALPEEVVEAVTSLSPFQLRRLLEFAQARLQFMEKSISELIEPRDDEEILSMKDYEFYTVVVKRMKNGEDAEESVEPPHVYVVTLEPEQEGGLHLHWEDVGIVVE